MMNDYMPRRASFVSLSRKNSMHGIGGLAQYTQLVHTPKKLSAVVQYLSPIKATRRRVSNPEGHLRQFGCIKPKSLAFENVRNVAHAVQAQPLRMTTRSNSQSTAKSCSSQELSIVKKSTPVGSRRSSGARCSSPEDSGYDSNSHRSYTDPSTPMSCDSGDSTLTASSCQSSLPVLSDEASVVLRVSASQKDPLSPKNKRRRVKENSNRNNNGDVDSDHKCLWVGCQDPTIGPLDDVVEHIQKHHVQTQKSKSQPRYVCLWAGCRVYNQPSRGLSWLETHVREKHAGPRPYKCIVSACNAGFWTNSALERHINAHFNKSDGISSESSGSRPVSAVQQEERQAMGNRQLSYPTSRVEVIANNVPAGNGLDVFYDESPDEGKPLNCQSKKYNTRPHWLQGLTKVPINADNSKTDSTVTSGSQTGRNTTPFGAHPFNGADFVAAIAKRIPKKRSNGHSFQTCRKYGHLVVPTFCSRIASQEKTGCAKTAGTRLSQILPSDEKAIFKRRSKAKGRRSVIINRSRDFIDKRSVEYMRNRILHASSSHDVLSGGDSGVATFHGEVIATRTDEAGDVYYYVNWTPTGIFQSDWIKREDYRSKISLPIRQLCLT